MNQQTYQENQPAQDNAMNSLAILLQALLNNQKENSTQLIKEIKSMNEGMSQEIKSMSKEIKSMNEGISQEIKSMNEGISQEIKGMRDELTNKIDEMNTNIKGQLVTLNEKQSSMGNNIGVLVDFNISSFFSDKKDVGSLDSMKESISILQSKSAFLSPEMKKSLGKFLDFPSPMKEEIK